MAELNFGADEALTGQVKEKVGRVGNTFQAKSTAESKAWKLETESIRQSSRLVLLEQRG